MNSLGNSICRFWASSIGRKLVVAVTGIALVGYLIGHMVGNLLIFEDRIALNDYADFLHGMLHGRGILVARLVLLTALVLHIWATVSLTRENRAARSSKYACNDTVQASVSSRVMIWTGLTVLAFIVFHVLHFTVRVDPALAGMKDPGNLDRHDVYGMVIVGFQNPLVVLFYMVSITLLCSHLSHGIASVFQTLGLRSEKTRLPIKVLGLGIALVLWAGFLVIPFLVITGVLQDMGPPAASDLSSEGISAKS